MVQRLWLGQRGSDGVGIDWSFSPTSDAAYVLPRDVTTKGHLGGQDMKAIKTDTRPPYDDGYLKTTGGHWNAVSDQRTWLEGEGAGVGVGYQTSAASPGITILSSDARRFNVFAHTQKKKNQETSVDSANAGTRTVTRRFSYKWQGRDRVGSDECTLSSATILPQDMPLQDKATSTRQKTRIHTRQLLKQWPGCTRHELCKSLNNLRRTTHGDKDWNTKFHLWKEEKPGLFNMVRLTSRYKRSYTM